MSKFSNMARTSMNAKKAMSGAAPRIKLGLKPTCATAARMPRANSSQATRGMSHRTTRRASVESISSLSSLTTAPPSPVHDGVLLPQQMVQWPTNRYCYLCHDGSKVLFCCDFCPRVVCQRCLGLAEVNPDLLAADVTFKCPGCHELGERDAQCKLSPYHSNIDPRHSCETSMGDPPGYLKVPLLFEASVKGSPRLNGSLPKLLHTSLEDYHTEDSLVYEEVFFDFGTDKKLRQWNRQASVLGVRLAVWNFGRKIIFIMVHSEINCGDLFAGKDKAGGDVAMEVEDFMKCIFTPPLDKVVYASTLFMLTCGHLVAFDESYTTMKQAIIRLRPEYTIMFTAPDFISAVAKMFVVTYLIQVLIQGHDLFAVFQDLLNVSTDLRMHTNMLIFYIRGLLAPRAPFGSRSCAPNAAEPPSISGYRYSWYHSHQRPWGKALPMGCSTCGTIRPWSRLKRAEGSRAKSQKAKAMTGFQREEEVRLEPLHDEYEMQGDKFSGWIKYTIWVAEII
ncbi:hypothetical protein EDC04DRAFT_2598818 [Pisolithus marmoratus]|nr:hypothetical protein EDC04DRAFT_2598818 [Pisolithus marmoratus]